MYFGLETELALSARLPEGGAMPMELVLGAFEATARTHLVHVDDGSRRLGMFMANGGLIYRDPLMHTEFCTPECDHPDEIVRQLGHAEGLLCHIAVLGKVEEIDPEILVSNINYCYASGHSFGSHENFSPARVDCGQIIPFLATRFLYSGSGGFVVNTNEIVFSISPRMHFITMDVCEGTQEGHRGLYHLKRGGVSKDPRLHLITGEGCRSELSTWLKFAITALVVEVLNAKHQIPPEARLLKPVEAAKLFALDPDCQDRAATADGGEHSAVEIQWCYLSLVEEHLAELPDWAPLACERWRDVLRALESPEGWRSLDTRLDWAIKRNLVFERHAGRAGWSCDRISAFNQLVGSLDRRMGGRSRPFFRISPDRVSEPGPRLLAALEAEQVDRDELLEFVILRDELRELDLRYHHLGPESLFRVLEDAGCLDHRVVEAPAGEVDVLDPPAPPGGRAALRGSLVRKFGARGMERSTHVASWSHFEDRKGRRMIEMSDAACEKEDWKDVPQRRRVRDAMEEAVAPGMLAFRSAMVTANDCLNSGDVELGIRTLNGQELRREVPRLRPSGQARYWRYVARIQARRQARDETLRALDALAEIERNAADLIFDQATLRCFLGLRGHESAREWIGKAEDYIAAQDPSPFAGTPFYRSHAAIYLNRWGDPESARTLLDPCLADGRLGQGFPHIFGRCQLAMSEVLRLADEPDLDRARELAREAVERYRRVHYEGALADFGLSLWATIEAQAGQPGRALELLDEAREIQKRLRLPSLLRTVCLSARIDEGLSPRKRKARRREAEVIISKRTGFQQCPLAREIVYHWDDWCVGEPQSSAPGKPDHFWGV